MLLISWNVAGWNTTVNRIHEHYSSTAATKSKQSSPIADYFRRHGDPTIVCLQEHKIPHQQLSSRSEPRQAATVPGYESFWSCCLDPQRQGFNGVVTYAKTGTVLRADVAPLRDPTLDQQGRCVMTDHGKFVVFNVYVPNSGGHPMAMKMKFLGALRNAMQRERRENGKAVILVGDYNISHKAIDIFWKNRTVHIQQVLDDVQAAARSNEQESLPTWKRDIAKHWMNIEHIMETREVVQTKTTNSLTKEVYDRYRLCVKVNDRPVFLGKHESCADYATHGYDFHDAFYTNEETGELVMTRENRTMCVSRLAELMLKLANVEWSEEVQREIARTEASEPRISPKRQWLTQLLEQDGMVDAFRHFYPQAEGRFTCWNQFTNCRYINEGARIDYTLIDGSLLPSLLKGDELRCCLSRNGGGSGSVGGDHTTQTPREDEENKKPDCNSEEMALRAATAGGMFQPVSFEGGGITEASQRTLDTQFGPPHTGMIYTPPSYSDHIGVSVYLDDSIVSQNLTLKSDVTTRKAQPHKIQRTIASFFGCTAPSNSAAAQKKSSLQRTVVKAPTVKKKSFFTTVTNANKMSSNKEEATNPFKRPSVSSTKNGQTAKKGRQVASPNRKHLGSLSKAREMIVFISTKFLLILNYKYTHMHPEMNDMD
eukprot:scaffold2536_cov169-Amphora_coffeaeformis.AAC.27